MRTRASHFGGVLAVILAIMATASLVTCTETNPEYCVEHMTCGEARWCDVDFNACRDIEDGGDGPGDGRDARRDGTAADRDAADDAGGADP